MTKAVLFIRGLTLTLNPNLHPKPEEEGYSGSIELVFTTVI